MTYPTPACCELHIDGPAGTCCDGNDCGPCCERCPTCPTLHNMQTAGHAYGRIRGDRGASDSLTASGVVSSVIVVIALCTVLRLMLGTDPVLWLDAAVDWCTHTIREIASS